MAHQTIVGIFDSLRAAEAARAALLADGLSENRVALSANLTEDGIAAEAPGQSYEHQSYRGSDRPTAADWVRWLRGGKASTDTDRARYNQAVRSGACLLTVYAESGEDKHIEDLMQQKGARITMERPEF